MPTYRRRERVVFLEDVNKDSFGRSLGAFPVGPNSEQKWARMGDTGVVSSWSKGGWLKVRLDRHGAIVTVRSGPYIGLATASVPKKTVWSQPPAGLGGLAHLTWQQLHTVREVMNNLFLHLEEAQDNDKPADVGVIEDTRLELETAARLLQKLSFSLPTQISPFPTKSFGALQSRGSTPSPVMVSDESSKGEAVERVDARAECTQLFG